MKENKYDDPAFFEKYAQMDRSRLGLKGAGEWRTLEKLLPDFAGRDVLDLGWATAGIAPMRQSMAQNPCSGWIFRKKCSRPRVKNTPRR